MDLLTQLCMTWAWGGAEIKTASLQEIFWIFFYLTPAASFTGGEEGWRDLQQHRSVAIAHLFCAPKRDSSLYQTPDRYQLLEENPREMQFPPNQNTVAAIEMPIFTSKQSCFIKAVLSPSSGRARVVLAYGFTERSIKISSPKLIGLSIQTLCLFVMFFCEVLLLCEHELHLLVKFVSSLKAFASAIAPPYWNTT